MSRTRTWYIDLPRAFPADRPIAGLMSRIMVLWADALLEYGAIGGENEGRGGQYEVLDRLDPIYRRMFFWRSLLITISSARKVLNRLVTDADFSGWLDADVDSRRRFFEGKAQVDRYIGIVDRIRNSMAAHIEEDVGEAPKHISPGTRGFIDVGGSDVFRPRLATQLLLATLFSGVPEDEQEKKMYDLLTGAKTAFDGMVNAMAEAVELYRRHYPLFPR